MRVVHVSPMYFSDESYIGGGERYALELARAMAELVPTALVSFGRDRRTFTVDHLQVDIYPALRRRLEQPVSLAFLPSLAAADVIHCHHVGTASTTLALLAGRALGRPRFVTPLGLHASVTQDWLSRLAGISKLLCISQFSALQAPYRVPTHVIYGGVNDRRFGTRDVPRKPKIVYVGRLLPHKGINYLIEALDSDMRLELYGSPYDGRYYRDLQDLARGKDVHFVTDASDEDVAHAFSSALVSVLPSVHLDMYGKWYPEPELLGLVVLEAMASGTPVIGTSVASIPELIADGVTGYLVPPNDPPALREALRRLYDDPAHAVLLGRRAREVIRARFTWEHVARRCLEAYS